MTDKELIDLVHKYQAEQRSDEVIWFYRHVEKIRPKVVVEIGIKEGGNLKVLSTHLDEGGLAIGIEPRLEIPWKMNDSRCKVFHIKMDSQAPQALEDLKDILQDRLIDVLFIDGNHSKEGMLADFRVYSPLVSKGGIIAVHDIYYLPGVRDAWAEIPGNQRFESPKDRAGNGIGIGFIIKE